MTDKDFFQNTCAGVATLKSRPAISYHEHIDQLTAVPGPFYALTLRGSGDRELGSGSN